MAIYRTCKRLGKGSSGIIDSGRIIISCMWPEDHLTRLLEVGAIEEVSSPPMAALPGWEPISEKCQPHGLTTLADLLDTPSDNLVSILELPLWEIDKLKHRAMDMLTVRAPQTKSYN